MKKNWMREEGDFENIEQNEREEIQGMILIISRYLEMIDSIQSKYDETRVYIPA